MKALSALRLGPAGWILAGVVLLGYLVNVTGPGTITPDSSAYIGMAESAHAGKGFLHDGRPTRFPPGYPALLATLMNAGAGTHFAVQALNLLAVAGGLVITLSVLARRGLGSPGRSVVALLALLSIPVLYSVNYILSDSVFFLGAALTIGLLERSDEARGARRAALLLTALGVLALTTLVRTAGVTLVPPFLLAVAAGRSREGWDGGGRRVLVLSAALLVGIAFTFWLDRLVLRTHYIEETWNWVQRMAARPAAQVAKAFEWKLLVIGEIILNIKSWRVRSVALVFPCVGAAALLALAVLLARSREVLRPAESFLACYVGMALVFPAMQHRYWLPVLPLALGFAALCAKRYENAVVRVLAGVYVVVFCGLGAEVLLRRAWTTARSPQPLSDRLTERVISRR